MEGGFTKIKNNLKTNPNTHTIPQHATATCVNSQEIIAQRRRAGLQTKMQKDEMMEYKRLETLRKICEGDERTEEMMRRKEVRPRASQRKAKRSGRGGWVGYFGWRGGSQK